jgi:hypothetical protein
VEKQQNETAKVDRIMVRLRERKRLTQLVLDLSYEVAQLKEDNVQLRAALEMYQKVLNSKPARPQNQPVVVLSAPSFESATHIAARP